MRQLRRVKFLMYVKGFEPLHVASSSKFSTNFGENNILDVHKIFYSQGGGMANAFVFLSNVAFVAELIISKQKKQNCNYAKIE